MKAMILAAGRGNRMRPLTDTTPKPLLRVGKQTLIEYRIHDLAKSGFKEIIINVSYHPEKFQQILGDGTHYGIKINYSFEPEDRALETGGGIYQALSLLGTQPFLVVNADIWTDFPFHKLIQQPHHDNLAHLVLINNPAHNHQGDFYLSNNKLTENGERRLTMAGITVYHPKLFANCQPGFFSVVPLIRDAISKNKISGEYYSGQWMDIGSVERLTELNNFISRHSRESGNPL